MPSFAAGYEMAPKFPTMATENLKISRQTGAQNSSSQFFEDIVNICNWW